MILVKENSNVLIPCNDFSIQEIKKLQGKEFYIEVKKDKRTIQQNKLLWMWITILGEHFGYSKEDMKILLLTHLNKLKVTTNKKTGEVIKTPIDTHDLSITDFKDLLMEIDNFAVSNGIVLPNPEEFLNP